jgi:hypothetical protein
LNLLPTKQREKIKAEKNQTPYDKLSAEEKAVVDAIKKHGKLTDIMKSSLESDPGEMIQYIQDQATATNADGSKSNVSAPLEGLHSQFGKEAVEKAIALKEAKAPSPRKKSLLILANRLLPVKKIWIKRSPRKRKIFQHWKEPKASCHRITILRT